MSRRLGQLVDEALAKAQVNSEAAPAAPAAEPAPRRGFIENRIGAFGEAARMVKKPTIRLKPHECSVWPGNARDYSSLTEEKLRSLIDSIIAEGGNRIPVVVRRTPNAERPYELIVGTRRHWAINWLQNNNYPEIDLVAVIDDLDDEAAFRLADIENRERADISDLERARNYRDAVTRFYGGVQSRMAERLRISNAKLSRLLALADLPPVIISAFADPSDITVFHGEKLAPLLNNPQTRTRLEHVAQQISIGQSLRRSEGEPPIAAPQVLASLLAGVAEARRRGSERPPLEASTGEVVGRVIKDDRRSGLTLQLTAGPDVDVDAIIEAIRPVIAAARIRAAKGK